MIVPRYPNVRVKLSNQPNKNVWVLLKLVRGALKAHGVEDETLNEFTKQFVRTPFSEIGLVLWEWVTID